jgi:toxin ParE1/3/4
LKKLKLHDEAEAELSEVFLYYAGRNPDTALKFYQEITDSFSHILRQPKIGSPIEEPYRKFVTTRFHYIIIYKETPEGINVDAVGHHSREPGYWRDRK